MQSIWKLARATAAALALWACAGPALAQAQDKAPEAARITKPDWAKKPSGEELAYVYPVAARKAEREGRATIECAVAASGRLEDCRVVSEDPEGEGFGPAALAMAWSFEMRPKSVDGQPVAGGMVRIPVRFTLEKAQAPEPADQVFMVIAAVFAVVVGLVVIAWMVVPFGMICHGVRIWPGWSLLMLVPAVNFIFLWVLGLKALAVRRESERGKQSTKLSFD